MNEPNPTALVVDDYPAHVKYIVLLFDRLNVNTITAQSGEEALGLIKKNESIDCVLLDIAFEHGMSGVDAVEEMKKQERFAEIPIIAISAYAKKYLKDEMIEKGFTDYLEKPFNMNQLREMLDKYNII